MTNSYTWDIFPISGTNRFETTARSVLDTWRNNAYLLDSELEDARDGYSTLKSRISPSDFGNDWDLISTDYQAVAGDKLLVMSSVEITLPRENTIGDMIVFAVGDYWGNNAFRIIHNSNPIHGESINIDISTQDGFILVYTDASWGWASISLKEFTESDGSELQSGSLTISTADTMDPDDTENAVVTGGTSPYSWEISGTGCSLDTTEGDSVIITTDATACGVCKLTVTDANSDYTSAYIRNTTGSWTSLGNQCLVRGTPDSFAAPYQIKTLGKYKQTQDLDSSGTFADPEADKDECQSHGVDDDDIACFGCLDILCNHVVLAGTEFETSTGSVFCFDDPDYRDVFITSYEAWEWGC